jgi:hypothetical protein
MYTHRGLESASGDMLSDNFLTSAQDSGQFLLFEGKTCSPFGSFTITLFTI